MEQRDFNEDLPAIWLVFGGSYLNYSNAPCLAPDKREQSLVTLLSSYMNNELTSPQGKQLYGSVLLQLTTVNELLKLWAQDLDLIYQIRNGNRGLLVKQMAQRLLERIQTFENCTIIPNGLISTPHTHNIMKPIDGCHDNVNLGILKKRNDRIDWVQVNPGSAYHQECPSLAGKKNNTFFEITEINLNDVTEDWLYLLVGLKAIHPGGTLYYKEVTLYECLLVFLNGTTNFQPQPDEGFTRSSPILPVHTWQVIDQSFRYLLKHFIGDTYHVIYRRLRTGFKLFLMDKVFIAYQNNKTLECHYLLQEMCCHVAQQAIDQGNGEQKVFSLNLIENVKTALEQRNNKQELQLRQECQLGNANVTSLSFVAPCINKYTSSSNSSNWPTLKVEPLLVKSRLQDDILDYLQQFKLNFMDKLICSDDLNEVALLSYGIEVFFIDYLAKTNILQTSTRSPFSRDDTALANTLITLAEGYFSCQARLVTRFLSNLTYQPFFYAKNVIIQFFVYAAVAALNFRDERIGSLLTTHNLSVAISASLSFHEIIPHFVIEDDAWVRLVFTLKAFFTVDSNKVSLFSYEKFRSSTFSFEIGNYAETNDTDVMFAYRLLQKYPDACLRFINDHCHLDHEKFNRKWQTLAYTDKYLPKIYVLLSKVAHLAKTSLTGLSSNMNDSVNAKWSFINTQHGYTVGISRYKVEYREYWRSIVSFTMNNSEVSTVRSSQQLTSYLLKASSLNDGDPYQRLIIRKENIGKLHSHFLENEIIASQDYKPTTMDRIRYMHLGFLQSEPQIKLERLYIALKEQQLDFTCDQESVLIQQTLFEISTIMKMNDRLCSILEWTVICNPSLIHKLGMLCIEKARVMQHRLTQHNAVGNILETVLKLLTFYPAEHIGTFILGITDVYQMLKGILAQPPANLSDHSLLHLNAYCWGCSGWKDTKETRE